MNTIVNQWAEDVSEGEEIKKQRKVLLMTPPKTDDATNSCRVIHIKKGIPKDWNFKQVKTFIMDSVKDTDCNWQKLSFFVVLLRDDALNQNGECLLKFYTPEECETTYNELKKNKKLEIQYDIDGSISKHAKFLKKTLADLSKPKVPDNKYELIKKKHEEVFSEKFKEEEKIHEGEPPAKKMKPELINRPHKPKAFFPKERDNYDTYGLSPDFLGSLKLKLPLRNKVLLESVDDRVDDAKIREVFGLAGQVTNVTFISKKKILKHKVLVEFDHPVEAVQAISMFRGKPLYDRPMLISMDLCNFPKRMPEGLTTIGIGLGHDGEPLRGIRTVVEMQKVKEILLNMGVITNVATNKDFSPFSNPIQIGAVDNQNSFQNLTNQSPTNQNPTTQNALLRALAALSPATLLRLTTLAKDKRLLQHETGDGTASLLDCLQGQNVAQISPNSPNIAPNAPIMSQHGDKKPCPNTPHQVPCLEQSPLPRGNNGSAHGSNIPPYGHDAASYGHSPSPHGHSPPPRDHNPPELGHNPSPQSHNLSPLGQNPPHHGYNPLQPGHNPPQHGHNSLPHSHSFFPHGHNPPQSGHNPPSHDLISPSHDHNPVLQGQNLSLHGYNPSALDLNPPQHGHNPPSHCPNPPPHGVNLAQQGQIFPPHGYNPPPHGYNPPPHGYNPPPHGHNRPLQNARNFVQNVPQQSSQSTLVQNMFDREWKVRPQQDQSKHNLFGSDHIMYNVQQPSRDGDRGGYDKFGEDNTNSSDIHRSMIQQKVDDPERNSEMLVFTNLPHSVTTQALNAKMREVGELKLVEMTGQGRAIVWFKHLPDAERCIKLFNRSKVDGQIIEVRYF